MNLRDMDSIAYDVSNLDDEEFIMFFTILMKHMLSAIGYVDLDSLEAEDVYAILKPIKLNNYVEYKNLFDWLCNICREVICETDIAPDAWWKNFKKEEE